MSDGTPGNIDEAFRRLDATDDELSALEEDQLGLNQGFERVTGLIGALSKEVAQVKSLQLLIAAKLGIEIPSEAR